MTTNNLTFDSATETIHNNISFDSNGNVVISNKTETENALVFFSEFVALSVLKRLHAETGGQSFRELTIDIVSMSANKRQLENILSNKHVTFDSDGNVKDGYTKEQSMNINRLSSIDMGDGIEIVNQAYIAIMENIHDMYTRCGMFNFTTRYEKEYVNKRVKKVDEFDSATEYEKREKSFFGHVFSSVRAYIAGRFNSIKYNPRNGYTYIEYESENSDGEKNVFYLRSEKFADLGGNTCHWNGHDFETTVTKSATEYATEYAKKRELIDALNMTKRETEIVLDVARGLSNSQIAKKYHISKPTVSATKARIRKRCEKVCTAEQLASVGVKLEKA